MVFLHTQFLKLYRSSILEETRELQKLRERPHGVSADALAVGRHIVEEETSVVITETSI